MVLEDTSERRFLISEMVYADVPLGLFIVRGDNVVLLGEVEDDVVEGSEELELEVERNDKEVGSDGGKTNTEGLEKLTIADGLVQSGTKKSTKLRKVDLSVLEELEEKMDKSVELKLTTNWDFDLDLS